MECSLENPRLWPNTGSRCYQQFEEGDYGNPHRDGPQRRQPSSFNADDAQELAKAEQRFYELTNIGFTAAVRSGLGQVSHIRSFDPNAEETVFFPRLVGG